MTGVALYHVMRGDEDFEPTAHMLWEITRKACIEHPTKLLYLFLDIEGHRNAVGGFDRDGFEIQQFVIKMLMPYLREAHLPIATMRNHHSTNAIPEKLQIRKARTKAKTNG